MPADYYEVGVMGLFAFDHREPGETYLFFKRAASDYVCLHAADVAVGGLYVVGERHARGYDVFRRRLDAELTELIAISACGSLRIVRDEYYGFAVVPEPLYCFPGAGSSVAAYVDDTVEVEEKAVEKVGKFHLD